MAVKTKQEMDTNTAARPVRVLPRPTEELV